MSVAKFFTVSPLILIRNQRVGVALGHKALLECEVEAFPLSVRYWERIDGTLIEPDNVKYSTSDIDRGSYQVKFADKSKIVVWKLDSQKSSKIKVLIFYRDHLKSEFHDKS